MPKAYAPYQQNLNGLMGFGRRRGLGDSGATGGATTATSAAPAGDGTSIADVSNFLNTANNALTKAGATQSGSSKSDVGKASVEISNVAKTAAGVATTATAVATGAVSAGVATGALATGTTLAEIAPFFGPAAAVVIAVAAVVIVAALLVDKFWGSSKPITPTINDYNDQLRDQINTVDQQTQKVTQALQTLGQVLKANGLGGITFSRPLNGSETVTPGLENELAQKVNNLKALIATFNTTVNQTYSAITGKSKGETIILWGLIGITLLGLGWFGFNALENKE